MKLFLVAQAQFKNICSFILRGGVQSLTNDMKLFLAESGGMWEAYFDAKAFAHAYILQSFFYADEFTEKYIIPNAADFLLDSGAFTFMQGAGTKIDWDAYLERYADFITRNGVKKFFELDIDSVVGYERVKEYRVKLERLTGAQCIPVWHKSRGIDEYKRHCEEYSYVAIGGYVVKEIKPEEYRHFPAMINFAHSKGAKVHCLGFTKLDALKNTTLTVWTARHGQRETASGISTDSTDKR